MDSRPFDLHGMLEGLNTAGSQLRALVERVAHEAEFAAGLARLTPDHTEEWLGLIERAVGAVRAALETQDGASIRAAASEAEKLMAPIGEAAKGYTIHCCGHGHIDMNWMWSWPETVSVTVDTFATVDRLMDEYPEFKYSQSQVSVYEIARRYCPELFERIRARVAEGRWEVTASQWVEGDKNLASGEILARHLLYSRRWFAKHLGLPYDSVKIDWECDTFGHAWTLPGILRRGGVQRYYHHRAGTGKRVYWWEGKDGSRVLAYDDYPVGYNCEIAPYMAQQLLAFTRETGLKDMMWVYGVGDHGGGPTRRHLDAAREMNTWPIWPRIRMATTDEYYSLVEAQGASLPVVKQELNYVFRGCYTAQTSIKLANRLSENNLTEAEAWAVLANALVGFAYPTEALTESWERAMLMQFHDILPGSGVRATREHCQGLLQEVLANTQAIRTRALRAIASKVNTAALAGFSRGAGLGAGVGRGAWWGGISSLGAGAGEAEPFVVFNVAPFARSEIVTATIWNREIPEHLVAVRDDAGGVVRGQVLGRGHHWGHTFTDIAFPAHAVPGLGYRTYVIERATEPVPTRGVSLSENVLNYGVGTAGNMTIENELLRVVVEPGSGAVASIVDKRTGTELVPPGKRIGLLVYQREAPHGMTSWEIGQVVEERALCDGASLRSVERGPHRASVVSTRALGDSTLSLTVSLSAGSPRVDFRLSLNWLERGGPDRGVPVLKVAFPLAISHGTATFEIPCGTIERPTNGDEVPALRWAGLSSETCGAALLNRSKYGYEVSDGEIRLTILRASYDPDPLPEVGEQDVDFALVVHDGRLAPSALTREAHAYNHPMAVVGTDVHEGPLPLAAGHLEIRDPNVMLSGLKRAEEGDAAIIRLYEIEGKQTAARVRLSPALAGEPRETDLLERPLEDGMARRDADDVVVTIPAYGIATVAVE